MFLKTLQYIFITDTDTYKRDRVECDEGCSNKDVSKEYTACFPLACAVWIQTVGRHQQDRKHEKNMRYFAKEKDEYVCLVEDDGCREDLPVRLFIYLFKSIWQVNTIGWT